MNTYKSEDIRTISLLGHSSSGKSALGQSILLSAKAIDQISDAKTGNSIFDFEEDEIKKEQSIYTSIASCDYKGKKINIVDTPGYLDFEGEKICGFFAGDTCVIVVNGKEDIESGCENAVKLCKKYNKPIVFFVNKMDDENPGFDLIYSSLKQKFGSSCIPFTIPNNGKYCEVLKRTDPLVTAYYNQIAEAIATADEALMDKFFEGQEFTLDEIKNGLTLAINSGDIKPIFFGSALKNEGVNELLDFLVDYIRPYIDNAAKVNAKVDGTTKEIDKSESAKFSGQVFKTVIDPFVGKISYVKVLSGTLTSSTALYNINKDQPEKVNVVSVPNGKQQVNVDSISSGDIAVLVKLQYTETGDTLAVKDNKVVFDDITFPTPMLGVAIAPKTKADEDKMSEALKKILCEDRTLKFEKNVETGEQILSAIGEQAIDNVINKLKNKYKVEITTKVPKIQYRETITKTAEAQGKHKKQSGGAGQYGDVHIRFEPCDSDDMIFEEEIFGGAVPKQYFPPTEQGLRECMEHGVLAGYKVVGVKCTLFDGSYHEVDSKEIAFKAAARLAYKAGMPKAGPVILEPIGKVVVTAPDSYTGVIMGDISKRNGSILNMTMNEDNEQVIEAEVPMAEMQKYATELRSLTQGRGSFEMTFDRYQRASKDVTDKVIKESTYVQKEEE